MAERRPLCLINGVINSLPSGDHSTPPTAAQVPYSNATSGLTATNVQAAMDETVGKISDLNHKRVYTGNHVDITSLYTGVDQNYNAICVLGSHDDGQIRVVIPDIHSIAGQIFNYSGTQDAWILVPGSLTDEHVVIPPLTTSTFTYLNTPDKLLTLDPATPVKFIQSNDINFDPKTSGISSTNANDAIIEVLDKALLNARTLPEGISFTSEYREYAEGICAKTYLIRATVPYTIGLKYNGNIGSTALKRQDGDIVTVSNAGTHTVTVRNFDGANTESPYGGVLAILSPNESKQFIVNSSATDKWTVAYNTTVGDLTVTGDFIHTGEGGIVTQSLEVQNNLLLNGLANTAPQQAFGATNLLTGELADARYLQTRWAGPSSYAEEDYFVDRYSPTSTTVSQRWSVSTLNNINASNIFYAAGTTDYVSATAMGEMQLTPITAATVGASGMLRRQNGVNGLGLVRSVNGVRWTAIVNIPTWFDGATNVGGFACGLAGALNNADYNQIGSSAMWEARSGVWECVISQGAGVTRHTTAVAVNANHTLMMERDAGGAEWRFYIDGTLIATLNGANVPTANLNPFFSMTRTAGTSALRFTANYYRLETWK